MSDHKKKNTLISNKKESSVKARVLVRKPKSKIILASLDGFGLQKVVSDILKYAGVLGAKVTVTQSQKGTSYIADVTLAKSHNLIPDQVGTLTLRCRNWKGLRFNSIWARGDTVHLEFISEDV